MVHFQPQTEEILCKRAGKALSRVYSVKEITEQLSKATCVDDVREIKMPSNNPDNVFDWEDNGCRMLVSLDKGKPNKDATIDENYTMLHVSISMQPSRDTKELKDELFRRLKILNIPTHKVLHECNGPLSSVGKCNTFHVFFDWPMPSQSNANKEDVISLSA